MLLGKVDLAIATIEEFEKGNLSYSRKTNLKLLKYSVFGKTGDTATAETIARELESTNSPEFILSRLRFTRLLISNGIDPFTYGIEKGKRRIVILKSIPDYLNNADALEALVDIYAENFSRFDELKDLESYIKVLPASAKLRLCLLLVKTFKPNEAKLILDSIIEKELHYAQEISKYRILKAVFAI
jgi:hypothetical protein